MSVHLRLGNKIVFETYLYNIELPNRLTEKRRIKVTQNTKLFTKLQNLSIVKYVNLKIMKLMWRENLM